MNKNLEILKKTVILGFPIIIQETMNSLTNFIDSFMIGKIGDDAISAVGVGNQFFFLFILLVFGIVSGNSAFMGQYFGKKDYENLHKSMGVCFICSTVIAAVFFIVAQLFSESIIGIFLKEKEVIKLGVQYLRIVSFSYFLNAISFTLNASLKCTRQTILPSYTAFVALISNISFNYIFIFIFKMGVVGTAIATVIARVLEIIVQIILIKKYKFVIYTKIKDYFNIKKEFMFNILKNIMPIFINEFFWAFGVVCYQIAYGKLGKEAFSAVQIASPMQQLFMVAGIGIGASTGILISNFLGAGEIDEAIDYSRKATFFAIILSAVMSVFLLFISPLILNNYDVSDIIKADSQKIIYVICIGMIFKTFNFTCIVGILRNGGDNLFCLIIDILGVWMLGVPLAFAGVMIFKLPIYWIYALVYTEEIFKLICCFFRVKSNIWARSLID